MSVTKEFIRHSNLIEGVDNEAEDKQCWEAWLWLKDQKIISQIVMLELHRKIMINQMGNIAGHFRNVQVYVGNHVPPNGEIMRGQLYGWGLDLLERYDKFTPREMHVRFEKIHPFLDGNGRTGRMLMWWHELKVGQDPTMIRSNEADRHYYYQWFRENDDD